MTLTRTQHEKEDKAIILQLYRRLLHTAASLFSPAETLAIRHHLTELLKRKQRVYDEYGCNIICRKLQLALVLVEELKLDKTSLVAAILYDDVVDDTEAMRAIETHGAADVRQIIQLLRNVETLYQKNPIIESENFRNLLLTFAQDVRVILILLADRLTLMRALNNHPDEELRKKVAHEASYLYAPLAHRLGVYQIKTELEDLSLKYTNREIYRQIAQRLRSKKSERKAYIEAFIQPIKEKLESIGMEFEVKGRPKSIHSIWNKIRKQEVSIEQIYDLFAIRIVINTPPDNEKSACWHVYSIIADMYQPNPKRMRDWLTIPKSNGYESLHTTVNGPQNKWVEVQIRTQRMDEIAERGLAAHWKYKEGGGSSNETDKFLTHVREMLESSDGSQDLIRDFKLQLNNEEIYVFTPKGDLHQLNKGATVLDFAFHVHSNVGAKCVGARINRRNVTIRQLLQSGDQVEIQTSNAQTPKQDWLHIVTTSKARAKIRQSLKEIANREAEFGKEAFERRMKNRKIEINESLVTATQKKSGYKTATEFFTAIGSDRLDLNSVIELYLSIEKRERELHETTEVRTAEGFVLRTPADQPKSAKSTDILIIDKEVSGIDYKLAKCCNPIFGDKVFAFVSINGVKIHRHDCPNAPQMKERFPYRIKEVAWSGTANDFSICSLNVIGNDDIGVVATITSLIANEKEISMRGLHINSHDGLFEGRLTLSLKDISSLNSISKKIAAIKGVKKVMRS